MSVILPAVRTALRLRGEVAFTVPDPDLGLGHYGGELTAHGRHRPWTTWADVHSDWLRVDQYPLRVFEPAYRTQLFLFFYVMPASSLLFFLFFGFGEQAVRDYSQSVDWIRRSVFKLPPRSQKTLPKAMKLKFVVYVNSTCFNKLTSM